MGAILRNSPKVHAMVVYTSKETKLALNEGKYTGKISNIAYKLNIFLGINILFVLTAAISMSQIGNRVWNTRHSESYRYIFDAEEQPVEIGSYSFKAAMSFYLLLCNIVPLDMAVSMVIARVIISTLIMFDAQMVDEQLSMQEGSIKGCEVRNLTKLEDFA